MNAIEMIRAQLEILGADGLCNSDAECGCGKDDLMLCADGLSRDCVAARKAKMPEGGDPRFGDDWYVPMEDEQP